MLKLILQNLEKRKIQSVSTFLAVLISVAVLFALFLLYNGVSSGIETSRERMGADIVVVPRGVESLMDDTELLFTGAPATIYMSEDAASVISKIDGVERTTVQFYGQTLNSACCSTGAEQRIIGYDASTDWILEPWAKQQIGDHLKPNEIVIGCKVGGYENGKGALLGHDVKVAAVLEASGTSLDYSILMDLDTARKYSKEIKGYDHFWKRYGDPRHLISAVMVKTEEGRKNAVANVIELKGNYKCITSSDVMAGIQSQLTIIFWIMLGAALLLCFASIFQLFARFYSMAWDRKSELGLYRAMGASEKDLRNLILGEAMILSVGGAVIGLAAGAGLYKLLLMLMAEKTTFPFIPPSASIVIAGIGLHLAVFAILGCLAVCVPLRQIGKIDPSMAMQKNDID